MATMEQFTSDEPIKTGRKTVILFGADWHEGCGAIGEVLAALASAADTTGVTFGRVDVEESAGLAEHYSVTVVPTVVSLDAAGEVVESVAGEDAAKVIEAVQRLINETSESVVLNKWSRYVRFQNLCYVPLRFLG